MSRIGTSGSDPYNLPASGGKPVLPSARRDHEDRDSRDIVAKSVAKSTASVNTSENNSQSRGQKSAAADAAPQSTESANQKAHAPPSKAKLDSSMVVAREATGAAVRAAVDVQSGNHAAGASYTLHSVPWVTGDYNSQRAINLYEQNQKLPNTVGQAVELLPRVNEQI